MRLILSSRFAHLVLTAVLGGGSCGCSFIFVKGPPSEPRRAHVINCTTSKVAPILDSLFGGFEVVRTGLAIGASEASYQGALISRGADIGLGVAFTALFVGSAAYGFVQTGRCADIQEKFESPDEPDSSDKYDETTTPRPAKRVASPVRPTEPSPPSAAEGVQAAPATPPRIFDAQAARVAIEKALGVAAASCRSSSGQRVQGVATMAYGTDGHPSDVRLEPPPQDAPQGRCIGNALREATVPPFDGEGAVVKKRFDLGP